VHCHRDITAGTFKAPAVALAKWKKTVAEHSIVPSLASLTRRLSTSYLERFLIEPGDSRPHLQATMPRLSLTAADARDIVAYFAELEPELEVAPALKNGDLERGRALFETRGCTGCHTFGSRYRPDAITLETMPPEARRAVMLAPDLAHTRRRFRAEVLVSWLINPSGIKPDTLMPSVGLNEVEAGDLSAFIMNVDVPTAPAATVPARLPPLERHVGFREVDERVLSKTCRHCHANPATTRGDGGPGSSGGFGFPPRRLDLSSYSGVAAGYVDAAGERRSVFEKLPDGTPRLLAALMARQAEHVGRAVPGLRGMPLGLPALSPEDIQIVESWIVQGRPL
jgi:cytochrome c2